MSVALGGIGLIGLVVTILIVGEDVAYPRGDMPDLPTLIAPTPHPPQRTWAEDPPTVLMAYTHAGPGRALTSGEARTAMQLHLDCVTSTCGWRREAVRTLVEIGELVPDPHQLWR
ncbi:hypothetical protein [Nocardia wallacei]|uniref:hypothetical protein n=1 Tax=Nocardia wallacei TaxID=480035 RepID=UPI00245793CB|nr:hypothetical protein [Nocardia wallacei]